MSTTNWESDGDQYQSKTTPQRGAPQRNARPPQRRRRVRLKKGPVFILFLLIVGLIFVIKLCSTPPIVDAEGALSAPSVDSKKSTYTIGLDPGHGGKDLGAEGYVREVDLTEMTTGYLKGILEADGRFQVIMSRKNGESKGIPERREKLLSGKPDLALSIHANSDETGTASGFECYPTPPGRANHESSMDFARALAKEMIAVGADVRGTDSIYFAYYDEDENGDDVKIIKESSDKTVSTLGSFGMVEKFSCPVVLVEQCFVNNRGDVEKFGNKNGSKKVAQAYYQAICQMLSLEAKS